MRHQKSDQKPFPDQLSLPNQHLAANPDNIRVFKLSKKCIQINKFYIFLVIHSIVYKWDFCDEEDEAKIHNW